MGLPNAASLAKLKELLAGAGATASQYAKVGKDMAGHYGKEALEEGSELLGRGAKEAGGYIADNPGKSALAAILGLGGVGAAGYGLKAAMTEDPEEMRKLLGRHGRGPRGAFGRFEPGEVEYPWSKKGD